MDDPAGSPSLVIKIHHSASWQKTETVKGLEAKRGKMDVDATLDANANRPTVQSPFVCNILGCQFILLKLTFDDFRCISVTCRLNNTKAHFNLSL